MAVPSGWLKGLVALALVPGMFGCGRASWETVYPATGSVLLNGKPLANAQVVLHPVQPDVPATVRPSATTDDKGQFQLSTYGSADGAPAGDYKVTVVHFPLVQSKGGNFRGPNTLPAKFAVPDQTTLTARVDAVATTIPAIELK